MCALCMYACMYAVTYRSVKKDSIPLTALQQCLPHYVLLALFIPASDKGKVCKFGLSFSFQPHRTKEDWGNPGSEHLLKGCPDQTTPIRRLGRSDFVCKLRDGP